MSNRTGSIYLITCLITEKVYVGQTVRSNVTLRWKDHIDTYLFKDDVNFPLYRSMRKFGLTNFTFQVLEENIPIKLIDEREAYYITKYSANNSDFGYNCTSGGQFFREGKYLKQEMAFKVIKTIKEHLEYSFTEIAELYDIPYGCVTDINCGETWYSSDEKYPLRVCNRRPNKLEEHSDEIKSMLEEGYTCREISNKFDVSVTAINYINIGKNYKEEGREYPIKKSGTFRKLKKTNLLVVIEELLKDKNISYTLIHKKLNGVGRKTVGGINNGTLYREELESLGYTKFPIRDNY